MKATMKRAIRDEKGAALALALVLLVVGGLILTPLLGLMSTGLIAGQVYEKKAHEYYAADAGVEDAIWKITHNETLSYPYQYQLTVGGKTVGVLIDRFDWDPTCGENLTYQILSIAATDGGGSTAATDTGIDANVVVTYMDFSSLLDYAIVSNETIDIQPNVSVNGSVWLPYEEGLSVSPGSEITGDNVTLSDGVSVTWPTFDELSAYYLEGLGSACDFGGSLDIEDTKTIGPCYTDGSLNVDNTGDPDTLVLEGTVYIHGNLQFSQPGSHNYTINLNGQTIFAEGYITFPSNGVGISGSGCIIARDYIIFQPSITSNPDDFVLVMSIEETVTVQPNGDFTGCVVGNEVVQLQPAQGEDFTVTWISPEGEELNFPMGFDPDDLPPVIAVTIKSWEIE